MRWCRVGRYSRKAYNLSTYIPTPMSSSRKSRLSRRFMIAYSSSSSSSLARSWRNLSVSINGFTSIQKRPRSSEPNGSHLEATAPLLLSSFPSGLTAPSRPHPNQSNLHFPHSCIVFHPTQMMFGLGTADGMMRLQGCQFNSGKDHYVPEIDAKAGLSGLNGRANGVGMYSEADAPIDFPTMR